MSLEVCSRCDKEFLTEADDYACIPTEAYALVCYRCFDFKNERVDKISQLEKENANLKSEINKRDAIILNYEKAIKMTYDTCLCERFKTKGFDYGEKHPRLKVEKGTRLNTPRDILENSIGVDWLYPYPSSSKGCIKFLRFTKIKRPEGYKNVFEWKKFKELNGVKDEQELG